MKTSIVGLAMMLLGSGITWMVHTVVHGEQVHAAQAETSQAHGEELRDHEGRTRALESAFARLSATDERLAAILERLEAQGLKHPRKAATP